VTRLMALAMLLLGCHPQAAVPAMPGQPASLDREIVAAAVGSRVDELGACLVDTDVVPGQQSGKQRAVVQLSISDTGRVQSATVKDFDDADANECITRKVREWTFPGGGLTSAHIELRIQAKSAELAGVRILPIARTADR
jgi:hypothetical protein